jgi:cytoskeleton-associated protein 5
METPPSPPNKDPLMSLINEVQHDDLNRVVDSLKVLQQKLDENADAFRDNVQTLTDTLMDAMDRAFSPPENLRDSQYFRLVKHLIQTVSAVTSNQDLMRRLSYDHVYAVISGLSLHLVQADRLGGHVSELSRFINMILVQTLSTTERQMVFRAMFSLLFELVRDFEVDRTPADSAAAAHADLVIKCLWKRCKVLDDDFRTGRLRIGPLLRVLEDFVQQISPSEFRRRATEGVAMGDMPLRTVKTVLQKMVGEFGVRNDSGRPSLAELCCGS